MRLAMPAAARCTLPDLERLFGPGIAGRVIRCEPPAPPLLPEELAGMERAIGRRMAEFSYGRHCARLALAMLGRPPVALPQKMDGTPRWPEGVVGSISHCPELCCAAVADAGEVDSLGVDIEPTGVLERRVTQLICRPDELERIADLPAAKGFDWPNVVFGAKEALFKCLSPVAGHFVEFDEVSLKLSIDASGCEGGFAVEKLELRAAGLRLPQRLICRWKVEKGFVLAGATAYH